MWIQTSYGGYALHYQANVDIIGETKKYCNGTVEVYLKDGRPLLKFERHGWRRFYWFWEETRFEYLNIKDKK